MIRILSVKLPVDDVSNLIIPSSLFVVSSPVSIVILATVVPFQFPLKCTKPCPAPERLLSPIKSAGAADAGCISRSVPLKVKVDSPSNVFAVPEPVITLLSALLFIVVSVTVLQVAALPEPPLVNT